MPDTLLPAVSCPPLVDSGSLKKLSPINHQQSHPPRQGVEASQAAVNSGRTVSASARACLLSLLQQPWVTSLIQTDAQCQSIVYTDDQLSSLWQCCDGVLDVLHFSLTRFSRLQLWFRDVDHLISSVKEGRINRRLPSLSIASDSNKMPNIGKTSRHSTEKYRHTRTVSVPFLSTMHETHTTNIDSKTNDLQPTITEAQTTAPLTLTHRQTHRKHGRARLASLSVVPLPAPTKTPEQSGACSPTAVTQPIPIESQTSPRPVAKPVLLVAMTEADSKRASDSQTEREQQSCTAITELLATKAALQVFPFNNVIPPSSPDALLTYSSLTPLLQYVSHDVLLSVLSKLSRSTRLCFQSVTDALQELNKRCQRHAMLELITYPQCHLFSSCTQAVIIDNHTLDSLVNMGIDQVRLIVAMLEEKGEQMRQGAQLAERVREEIQKLYNDTAAQVN